MTAVASLGQSARRGAVVAASGQGVRLVVQLASVVVLARLLAPSDYGLMAIVLVVVGLGEILRDFGLSAAAVQATDITRDERVNLFWVSTAIGAVLTVLVAASAPIVGLAFGDDRLVLVTVVLASTFLLNGMSTQFRADLARDLRFGRLTTAEVGGQVIGLLVAVVLAVLGAGYWALVAQQLVQAAVALVVTTSSARFRPGRWRRDAPVRRFVSFGADVFGGQIIGYISKNTDTVIIGALLGPVALGFYNRAFQLVTLPLAQLNTPATRVALPVLSRLQGDRTRFDAFLLTGQTVLLHAVIAVFSFGAALAVPAFDILLGSQWAPSAPLFQILAIAGVFSTAGYATYWVFLSEGLTRSQLWWQVASRPFFIAIVATGLLWGVQGVAAAYATASGLAWVAGLFWIRRVSGAPVRRMATNGLRTMTGYGVAAAAGLAGVALAPAGVFSAMAVGAAGWLLGLGLVVLVWPAFRRDARLVLGTLRAAVRRRAGGRSKAPISA